MEIRELTTEAERREAVPILEQLWTGKTEAEILAWTGESGYHLFGGLVEGQLVGVAGVVLGSHLHHTRHAWLYDLVVDEAEREHGYGTALLEFVEGWAADAGCDAVALASPLGKEGVHQYYTERAYEKWGFVIEKPL